MREYATRFFMLLEQATRLDAINSLNDLNIVQFPHLKTQQQEQTRRAYLRQAHPGKKMTTDQVNRNTERLISLLGIKRK